MQPAVRGDTVQGLPGDRIGSADELHDGTRLQAWARQGPTPGGHPRPDRCRGGPLGDREQPVTSNADQVDRCVPIPVPCRLHEVVIHRFRLTCAPGGGARLNLLVEPEFRAFILRVRQGRPIGLGLRRLAFLSLAFLSNAPQPSVGQGSSVRCVEWRTRDKIEQPDWLHPRAGACRHVGTS